MAEQKIFIENSSLTTTVSGTVNTNVTNASLPTTVTNTPSVNVANTPSMTVSGPVTTVPSGTQNVSGLVNSVMTSNPNFTGVYVMTLAPANGVAAANVYMSLYNPVGSGKNLILGGAIIGSAVAGSTTVVEPMIIYRFSGAPTGGTVSSASIAKFQSSYPTSVAEVRTANPTLTTDGLLSATFPDITSSTIAVHPAMIPTGFGTFTIAPGEGIAFKTATGNTQQRWSITQIWGEM